MCGCFHLISHHLSQQYECFYFIPDTSLNAYFFLSESPLDFFKFTHTWYFHRAWYWMLIIRYLWNKWVLRTRILSRVSIISISTSTFMHLYACTHTYTYICDKDCTQRKQSWSFFKAMILLWIIVNDCLSSLWEGYASIMGFGRLSPCLNLLLILSETRVFFKRKPDR